MEGEGGGLGSLTIHCGVCLRKFVNLVGGEAVMALLGVDTGEVVKGSNTNLLLSNLGSKINFHFFRRKELGGTSTDD